MAAAPALALLEQSRQCLAEAYAAELATERYLTSQDAAMRAAAALVAVRGRRGPQDLWPLLAAQVPELGEWADFFALAAVRRQQIEAGRSSVRVPVREADDLLRAAETFVELVVGALGMPVAPQRGARRLVAARESA